MKLFSTIAAAALVSTTQAWYGTGHLLVARIANDILSKNSPQTLEEVESVLAVLEKSDPSYTKAEGKHPFVECTTFADDIKFKGGSYQSGWHFIDTPYLDEGGKISDFNFTEDAHNVTEAISTIVDMFTKKGDWKKSYEFE